MADLSETVACVISSIKSSKRYIKYLNHFALQRVEHHTHILESLQDRSGNACIACFITQEYLDRIENWGDLIPAIQTAHRKGVAIIALLDSNAEPIMLARSFDYGFDEVLCLGSANHEFAARLRHCLIQVEYKHLIGEREGIDPLTGLMRPAVLGNHLIAAQAYALRHGQELYGTRFHFDCINRSGTDLTLNEKNRLIESLANVLKSICRPYDAAFSMSRTNFLVIWNSISGAEVPKVSCRIGRQLFATLSTHLNCPELTTEILNIPLESECDIENMVPMQTDKISDKLLRENI